MVADSTVIVQHAASVIIFVCCFTIIFQERVSPVTIVGYGTLGTVLGWFFWDFWVGQEEANKATAEIVDEPTEAASVASTSSKGSTVDSTPGKEPHSPELVMPSVNAMPNRKLLSSSSASVLQGQSLSGSISLNGNQTTETSYPPYVDPVSILSPRNQQRLATFKSAVLIYCALLGLSPILKSLTESTSSDSIWAISTWLMCINIFFFNYGGEPAAK